MNRFVTALLASSLLVMFSTSARALDGFSRACRLDWIPVPMLANYTYVVARYASGRPEWVDLAFEPVTTKTRWWILESITIDWFQERYYLWASSAQYKNSAADPYTFTLWRIQQGPWQLNEWNAEALQDSAVQIFASNYQGFLPWSARSGGRQTFIEAFKEGDFLPQFYVYGAHYYFDPKAERQIKFLKTSQATDCNLTQWGFGPP